MGIKKYLVFRMFSLVLCFSYLGVIDGVPAIQEKQLSAWDDSNDWWKKDQTTEDPFDLNRWDRFTFRPDPHDEYDYLVKRSNENSGIYFAVFVVIFVFLSSVLACMKFYCQYNNANPVYDTVSTNDSRSSPTSQWSSVPTISRTTVAERPHIILQFSNPVSAPSNRVYLEDEPPRYDEVVIGDLSADGTFPEFQPVAAPETPPPQYDDNNPPRY